MSADITYFFNSDKSLQELSDEINECLGTNLRVSRPHQKEQAWCIFFGMSLDFYEHTLKNDGLNEYQSFRYLVDLTGPQDVACMRAPLLGMLAYFLYHRLGIGSGLLVYNLGRHLAIYETRFFEDNGKTYKYLFDTISDREVEMPEHLTDLELAIKD